MGCCIQRLALPCINTAPSDDIHRLVHLNDSQLFDLCSIVTAMSLYFDRVGSCNRSRCSKPTINFTFASDLNWFMNDLNRMTMNHCTGRDILSDMYLWSFWSNFWGRSLPSINTASCRNHEWFMNLRWKKIIHVEGEKIDACLNIY